MFSEKRTPENSKKLICMESKFLVFVRYVFANVMENPFCRHRILKEHPEWIKALIFFVLQVPAAQNRVCLVREMILVSHLSWEKNMIIKILINDACLSSVFIADRAS